MRAKNNVSAFSRVVGVSVLCLNLSMLSGCGGPRRSCPKPPTYQPEPGYGTLTGGYQIGIGNAVGSLGGIAYDKDTGRPMLFTNCHVANNDKKCEPVDKRIIIDAGNPIGHSERGEWDGTLSGTVPDYAVVNIEYSGWSHDAKILDIGDIEGIGTPHANQLVEIYDNQSSPPVVRKGIISPSYDPKSNRFNVLPRNAGEFFTQAGNSGSFITESESKHNLIVGQYFAGDHGFGRTTDTVGYVQDAAYIINLAKVHLYNPTTNPIALFRYMDADDPTIHLYSTYWEEMTLEGLWPLSQPKLRKFERREGALFLAQVDKTDFNSSNLSAFLRYYNRDTDDMILTTNPNELGNPPVDSPWCALETIGYLPPPNTPGTTRLYRYFNGTRHLYTTDSPDVVDTSWNLEPEEYWVFSEDGHPDPDILYQGPPLAQLTLDPVCSSITVKMGDTEEQAIANGTVELSIQPGCTGPHCSLTIAHINLHTDDATVDGHTISQMSLRSVGYALGSWNVNNTFSLPYLSTTISTSFKLDGNDQAFTLRNNVGTLQGTLGNDYSNFTITGDFVAGNASLHLGLCGHATGRPPVAVLTPPGPFQCDSSEGAHVAFSSAQSYDPDNDIQHQVWGVDNQVAGRDVTTISQVLSLGAHDVSVTVSDSRGASDTAGEKVQVIDTTPPQVTTNLQQTCLYPPNHKLVLFSLSSDLAPQVKDSCDSSPQVKIMNVSSNQPNTGGGSGNTDLDVKFGSGAFCVRAERDGTVQTPREYTVTLEATDHSGNKVEKQVIISVPHDQGGGKKCDIKPAQVVEDDDPRCTM